MRDSALRCLLFCSFGLMLSCTIREMRYTEEEASIWLPYRQGQQLVFDNSNGIKRSYTVQQITIVNRDWVPPGIDSPGTGRCRPFYTKTTLVEAETSGTSVLIETRKALGESYLCFDFMDFHHCAISKSEFLPKLDSKELLLENGEITSCYVIPFVRRYDPIDKVNDPKQIFWSKDYGLVRYEKYNGEIWNRVNL